MTRINCHAILRNETAIVSIVGLFTVILLWLRQAFPVYFAGITMQG